MPFEPGKIRLSASPLAMVMAQFTLQKVISVEAMNTVRESLRKIGISRLTKKRERSVSITPASINPVVKDFESSILLDPMNSKGVSAAEKSVSCFTSAYTSFGEFLSFAGEVVRSLSDRQTPFDCTSIALRYVNVFDIGNDPTTIVTQSLGGLKRTGIGKDHHHHNYEFWCDTEYGKLTLRYSTMHGDRKPAQLGHAEVVFPTRFLKSYDELVGHIDIIANTKTLSTPVDWNETTKILQKMNLSIEQAFLNAINEEALRSRFGAEEKL